MKEELQKIIEDTLKAMTIEATVECEESPQGLVFNLRSPDHSLIIGRGGMTLHALSYMVFQMARKKMPEERFNFSIDVDDYKRKHEWSLKEQARLAIEKSKRINAPVPLPAMPSFDRRFIHTYIRDHYLDIDSFSEGFGDSRKIVVKEKNKPA